MASLPDFRAFNQAAAHAEGSTSNVEMGLQGSVTQVKATVDGTSDKVDDDLLATSAVQAPQAPGSPITKPLPLHVDEVISSELASLRAKASSMSLNPEDPATVEIYQRISKLEQLQSVMPDSDSVSSPTHQATLSALRGLQAIASTKASNPQDPENVILLQQLSNLEQLLAKLESDSPPNGVLPIISINITESIIYVTMGIARFVLRSVMPPAALAVGIMLAVYPQSGDLSTLSVALLSLLVILTTAEFYLMLSAYTMIEKNHRATFSNTAGPDLSKLDAASYLFVLGSGGHTTEMISLVKLSQKPYSHTHRRYLMTVGDTYSLAAVKVLEENIAKRYPDGSAGTSDMIVVTRARSVHQSYITSVFTSLRSFSEIVGALTNIPFTRAGQPNAEAFRSPHVIVTNGPGTGFIVGLVAFLLKMFRVVPRDRLKVVFMETWARTHSLGLTGKLFDLTQIADVFVVQSEVLAQAVNKPNIGNVNKMWSGLVDPPSQEVSGPRGGCLSCGVRG